MGAGVAIVAAMLSGCVAVGLQVTEDDLKQFPIGTPDTEIVQKLGEPLAAGAIRGHRTMIYMSAQPPHPERYIPLIGSLMGGADSRSSYAILELDDENKLVRYSVMGSSAAAATGFGADKGRQ